MKRWFQFSTIFISRIDKKFTMILIQFPEYVTQ
jgi:hypothetical protein